MPFEEYKELTPMHLDALCEIGNIGSGNAATALSDMLDRPVNISVPKVNILDFSEVVDKIGGSEQILVGILLSVTGDITGMMMFLLQKEFAHMVLNTLTGDDNEEIFSIDELSRSAIKEVGNILASSYVNVLSQMTDLKINISVPSLAIDMAGALLSVPAIYYEDISSNILYIENKFGAISEEVCSHVMLIPENESLSKILKSLGLDV